MKAALVLIALWLGCGLVGSAGRNAYDQHRRDDLGCDELYRTRVLAEALLGAGFGPINLVGEFFTTAFFWYGLSFSREGPDWMCKPPKEQTEMQP